MNTILGEITSPLPELCEVFTSQVLPLDVSGKRNKNKLVLSQTAVDARQWDPERTPGHTEAAVVDVTSVLTQ